jgi:hypothetical protein
VVVFQAFISESDPYLYVTDSVSLSAPSLLGNDVTADEFLQYATEDLSTATSRGAINALGNAKRALHLTIDSLLNAYGLLAKNRRVSFPDRLRLLDAAGLFSLSILNTLNVERNVMEHEYKIPTNARVQEVVDVTRLLLLATQRMRENVVYECLAGWRANNIHGVVQLNPNQGYLSFFKVTGENVVIVESPEPPTAALLPIRTSKGGLIPGVGIDTSPVWSVKLALSNMDEWPPLLRPIIDQSELRFGTRFTEPVIYEDTVRVAMQVHLPRVKDQESLARYMAAGKPILDFSEFTFESMDTVSLPPPPKE